MFVEKLTVNQVKEFLNEIYPEEQGFDYAIDMSDDTPYICVNVDNDKNDFDTNMRLEDYDATISWTDKWLRYLYKVFGEEYKQAYIQDCLSVFDED